MCNCGNKPKPAPKPAPTSGTTQQFALNIGGTQTTFGSRLEADAANVRAGRRGSVQPVKR